MTNEEARRLLRSEMQFVRRGRPEFAEALRKAIGALATCTRCGLHPAVEGATECAPCCDPPFRRGRCSGCGSDRYGWCSRPDCEGVWISETQQKAPYPDAPSQEDQA